MQWIKWHNINSSTQAIDKGNSLSRAQHDCQHLIQDSPGKLHACSGKQALVVSRQQPDDPKSGSVNPSACELLADQPLKVVRSASRLSSASCPRARPKPKDLLHRRIRRWGFDDGEPFQLRSFNYARKAYHAGKEMVVCVTSIPCPRIDGSDKLSVK